MFLVLPGPCYSLQSKTSFTHYHTIWHFNHLVFTLLFWFRPKGCHCVEFKGRKTLLEKGANAGVDDDDYDGKDGFVDGVEIHRWPHLPTLF